MDNPLTLAEQVRLNIAEQIPEGGTDADTMFSDREIEHFLGQGYGDPNAASYFGWLAKMANFANLVSVNEGNAMRELTELHRNASRMVTRYEGYAPAMGKGRARIGYISRSVGYA